jgi:uncharacterized protein (TIGR03085 family)
VLTESGQVAPTLCEGWLTRDLAAHLFVRERRPVAMPGILLGGPLGELTAGSMASALRRHGYAGLVAKVRSGPPLLWRPLDDIVNLVEFFVHTEDMSAFVPGSRQRHPSVFLLCLSSAVQPCPLTLLTRLLTSAYTLTSTLHPRGYYL